MGIYNRWKYPSLGILAHFAGETGDDIRWGLASWKNGKLLKKYCLPLALYYFFIN